MKLRYRRRLRLGPMTINISNGRWTSTTWRLGPLSWNSQRTGAGLDLPGGLSADLGKRKRKRAQ